MAPRRNNNNNNNNNAKKKKGAKKAMNSDHDLNSNNAFDGNDACEFSLDFNDDLNLNQNHQQGTHQRDREEEEEEKVEIEAEDANANENINQGSFQASFSCFEQTEDQRLQKAGYKTEKEIRKDLTQQPLARKDSIQRERKLQRQLARQASANRRNGVAVVSPGEDTTTTPPAATATTANTRNTRRTPEAPAPRQSRFSPFAAGSRRPDEPSSHPRTAPFVSPPPLEEVPASKKNTSNNNNTKDNNESNSTMDTNATELTMDDALRDPSSASNFMNERLDEEVALGMARQRPRWPLLQWANPFPHRRARQSTTRRAKQAKSQRQGMRHGSNLGILQEGESLTDDETEDTANNNNVGQTPAARNTEDDITDDADDDNNQRQNAARLPHGSFWTFWCWCWATRGCMISMALTILITLAVVLIMMFVVNKDSGSSGSPAIRGASDTPTMAPVGSGAGIFQPTTSTTIATQSGHGSPTHPTPAAGSSPSSSPIMDVVSASQLESILPDFTIQAIQLGDQDSPQYKAVLWLQGHPQLEAMPIWKQKQLLALVTFYHAFSGDNWPDEKKQGWLSYTTEECEWGDPINESWGNGCHNSTTITTTSPGAQIGRFQHLNLDWFVGHTIAGFPTPIKGSHMPPEVSLLTDLESLGIMSAGLQATLENLIPTELVALTSLQRISFHYNDIVGTIPAHISQMTGLQHIEFGQNYLSGFIPPQLSSLTNLQELKVFNNRLEGSIPASLGSLTNMRGMTAIRNFLTGTIPASLFQWTSLEYLYLDGNSLTGTLPMNLCQLDNIEAIFVDCTMGCPIWCPVCECFD